MDMAQIAQMLNMQTIQQNGFSVGQMGELISSGVSFADIIQMMTAGTRTGGGESVNAEYMGIINTLTENLIEGQLTDEQQYYPVIPQKGFTDEAYMSGLNYGLNNTDKADINISDFSEDVISADPVQLSGLLGVVMTGNSIPENSGIISTLYKEMPVIADDFSENKLTAYDFVNKYIESGELEIVGFTPQKTDNSVAEFKVSEDFSSSQHGIDFYPAKKSMVFVQTQRSAENKPAEKPAVFVQTQKTAENKPAENPAVFIQTQKTAENKPAEKSTVFVPSKKSAENKQAEESAMFVQAQNTAENKTVEETADFVPSQKPAENKPVQKAPDFIPSHKAADSKPVQKAEDLSRSQGDSDNSLTQENDENLLSFYRIMQTAKEAIPPAKKTETAEPEEIGVLQENAAELDIRFDQISSDIKMKEGIEPPEKQLLKGVEENLKKGNNEFTVKLRPEGLGEIIVKLVQNDGGKMLLSMTASNLKTAELLNSNLSSLQSSLSQHNVEIVNPSDMTATVAAMTPAFEQYYGHSGSNQQNQQFYNRNHGFTAYSEVDDAETFNEKAAASVEKGGLDIVI